jgi:hypothetical protein
MSTVRQRRLAQLPALAKAVKEAGHDLCVRALLGARASADSTGNGWRVDPAVSGGGMLTTPRGRNERWFRNRWVQYNGCADSLVGVAIAQTPRR